MRTAALVPSTLLRRACTLLPLALVAATAACGQSATPSSADRAAMLEALSLAEADPGRAYRACDDLGAGLRAECVGAVVEANPRHAGAPSWCGTLTGVGRDECFFQIAERTRDLDGCAHAGAFADDCRLHLWTSRLDTLPRPGGDLGAWVPSVETALRDGGFDVGDHRYWSAAFRLALSRTRPFDRSGCKGLTDAGLADACWRTGLAVYGDLLNRTRDFGSPDCSADPPQRLRQPNDPELARILAARWSDDICGPGRIRR